MCDQCQALARQNQELRKEIRNLRQKLRRAIAECERVQAKATPILSRRSGVPRGFWSRIKGRVDVADIIVALLC